MPTRVSVASRRRRHANTRVSGLPPPPPRQHACQWPPAANTRVSGRPSAAGGRSLVSAPLRQAGGECGEDWSSGTGPAIRDGVGAALLRGGLARGSVGGSRSWWPPRVRVRRALGPPADGGGDPTEGFSLQQDREEGDE
ncbi:unnamed protein product [Gadus morhua 'NCC']